MASKILTPRQSKLLAFIGANTSIARNFYLTGGTALSAFYLFHRYSEDLDFFTDTEIDILSLDVFFKKIKTALQFRTIDYQQTYNRNLFFLNFGDEILKVEFTFFPFLRIERGIKSDYGVEIDSLLDIAVNKLFTIYQRTQARDYIDLYVICKEKGFTVNNLIKNAKAKFDWHIDPVQLGTQFMKSAEAEDYPRMIKKISHEEWRKFFLNEARNLKPEILT